MIDVNPPSGLRVELGFSNHAGQIDIEKASGENIDTRTANESDDAVIFEWSSSW